MEMQEAQDNAWMETAVYGAILQEKDNNVKVEGKDDAIGAHWMKLTPELYEKMTFASHGDMLKSGWSKISEKLKEEVLKRATSNEINPQNPLEQIEKMDNLLNPSKQSELSTPEKSKIDFANIIVSSALNSSSLNQNKPLPPIPAGKKEISLTTKDITDRNRADVLSLNDGKPVLPKRIDTNVKNPKLVNSGKIEQPMLASDKQFKNQKQAGNVPSTDGQNR